MLKITLTGLFLTGPFCLVAGFGLLLLAYEAIHGNRRQPAFAPAFAALALVAALVLDLALYVITPHPALPSAFLGAILPDAFGYLAGAIVLAAALLATLAGAGTAIRRDLVARDLFAFLLFATAGLLVMVQAGDLLAFAVGLETASLALYAMTGLLTGDARSREAALKYFIAGAFATALFLYGASLVYGATGSLDLLEVRKFLAVHPPTGLLMSGAALVMAGLLFKLSAVPFHMWTPDVYEGAPTPVVAFMSVAVKTAAAVGLVRLLVIGFGPVAGGFVDALVALSLVTMTVGNLAALNQTNLKRLLAWSSVAHAGYLLAGVAALCGGLRALPATENGGGAAVLFYLAAYTAMNFGAFAALMLFVRAGDEALELPHLSGVAKAHPVAAAAFSVFLLSLAGMPPLAGFMGKFAVFYAAMRVHFVGLALAGVLNSLLSVYYYLKVAVAMYSGTPDGETTVSVSSAHGFAVALALAATILLGCFPGPFLAAFHSALAIHY